MHYMGSKRRYAKELLPILLEGRTKGQTYVEPFCGSCAVLGMVDGPRIANDLHGPLIALYKALQKGWQPPAVITEEDYAYIKKNPVAPELKAFAGFYYSFGGKYLDTYARHKADRKGSLKNSQFIGRQSCKDVEVVRKKIEGVKFFSLPYYQLKIPAGSIVYCDPPYFGTTEYKDSGFDHNAFWSWVRGVSVYNKVFVSEYQAPKDFRCVWQSQSRTSFNNNKNASHIMATEKLFTL